MSDGAGTEGIQGRHIPKREYVGRECLKETSAGGEGVGGLLFHASLQVANERLTPIKYTRSNRDPIGNPNHT